MHNVVSKKKSIELKKFKRLKIMTVEQTTECLKSSTITARRQLKQWRTHTSYNKNGRYYVLPDVVQFDPNGLWHYTGVSFSQYGNLKNTVIQLVSRSEAGLKAIEIENLVKLSSRSFLSHFRNMPQLHREKVAGHFIYFSADETIRAKQKQKRDEQDSLKKQCKLPIGIEAIKILVERIKNPELSIKKLCTLLKKQEYVISIEELTYFFDYHGILKKTPDISS